MARIFPKSLRERERKNDSHYCKERRFLFWCENGRNERIYTLGTLIHNETYNKSLRDRGVRVTDVKGAVELAKTANADSPVTVFVRAHGIPRDDENLLKKLSEENPYFSYKDPHV